MSEKTKAAVIGGIALGVLYLIDAFLDVGLGSFVYPVLGGGLATYLYSRNHSVELSDGAKLGALSGVIGGLIVVVIGTPLVYFMLRAVAGNEIESQLRQSGIELPFGGFLLFLVGTAILAVVGLIISVIGGLLAALIFRRR